MPESKIETCEIELAKNNNNIAKFLEEHKVYNVKTKREIFNNFQKLKDSYLLSIKKCDTWMDMCKKGSIRNTRQFDHRSIFDIHTVARVTYRMVFDIIPDVTGRIRFDILYLYVIDLRTYV